MLGNHSTLLLSCSLFYCSLPKSSFQSTMATNFSETNVGATPAPLVRQDGIYAGTLPQGMMGVQQQQQQQHVMGVPTPAAAAAAPITGYSPQGSYVPFCFSAKTNNFVRQPTHSTTSNGRSNGPRQQQQQQRSELPTPANSVHTSRTRDSVCSTKPTSTSKNAQVGNERDGGGLDRGWCWRN